MKDSPFSARFTHILLVVESTEDDMGLSSKHLIHLSPLPVHAALIHISPQPALISFLRSKIELVSVPSTPNPFLCEPPICFFRRSFHVCSCHYSFFIHVFHQVFFLILIDRTALALSILNFPTSFAFSFLPTTHLMSVFCLCTPRKIFLNGLFRIYSDIFFCSFTLSTLPSYFSLTYLSYPILYHSSSLNGIPSLQLTNGSKNRKIVD